VAGLRYNVRAASTATGGGRPRLHRARADVRDPRRVVIPPEELGPKGDLNDWLGAVVKGDPTAFRSLLERALATSPTPWALQIKRLPCDLAPWDLEDHIGVRDLLCEFGHQGPLSRDAHLRILAERCGVALATLQEAGPRALAGHGR
jgi:hypothetical protein